LDDISLDKCMRLQYYSLYYIYLHTQSLKIRFKRMIGMSNRNNEEIIGIIRNSLFSDNWHEKHKWRHNDFLQ